MVNELHPPVKVTMNRMTKVRAIPHHDGEVIRRVSSGTVMVALATTPDMLWLQVGQREFVPTRDCKLEEPLHQESPSVIPLHPTMHVHVKGDVTVRKIPDIGGKPVGLLKSGDMVTAIAVTADYTWLQLGHKQFIPTAFAKLGDPTTPLQPPLTLHLRRPTVVRDIPSLEGNAVTTLAKDDVMQAVAVSSDFQWLKVAKNNYIQVQDARLGMPFPNVMHFPQPIMVKLHEDAKVVKNPNEPTQILRWLKKADELQVFGVTTDFKWLEVANKRFIPMISARLKSPIAKPIAMNPAVPIKMAVDTPVRHIPDQRGRVMSIVKKGDKLEAIGVSADFTWLQLGERMFVPLTSAYFRKPIPATNALVPSLKVTLTKDVKVRKTPDHTGKVVKTLGEGDVVTAIATTPDLEWLKIDEKMYIPADSAKLENVAETAPLYPFVKIVITKDAKVYKAPNTNALAVRRIKRGEVIKVHATTTDLKWLKIGENEFIQTEFSAHVPHTSPLTPPVRVVVAADVKARNVPAFAGMSVKEVKKGEVLLAKEVTPDFKWLKLGKNQFIPTSAAILHESEGKDMIVVLKIRNAHVDKDPVVSGKDTKTPDAAVTTSQAASLLRTAFAKRINGASAVAQQTLPTNPVMSLSTPVKEIRLKEDALVRAEPHETATAVKGLRAGTLVKAIAVDKDFQWIKIDNGQYIPIKATDAADQAKKSQL